MPETSQIQSGQAAVRSSSELARPCRLVLVSDWSEWETRRQLRELVDLLLSIVLDLEIHLFGNYMTSDEGFAVVSDLLRVNCSGRRLRALGQGQLHSLETAVRSADGVLVASVHQDYDLARQAVIAAHHSSRVIFWHGRAAPPTWARTAKWLPHDGDLGCSVIAAHLGCRGSTSAPVPALSGRPLVISIVNSLSAGGAEKQVLISSQLLAESGWQVWIVALSRGQVNSRIETLITQAQAAGVKIFRPGSRDRWFRSLMHQMIVHVRERAAGIVIWSWGHRAELARTMIQFLIPNSIGLVSLRSAHKDDIDRLAWFWRVLQVHDTCFLSNTALNLELLQHHIPEIASRSVVVYNALEKVALAAAPAALPNEVKRIRIVMLGNIRVDIKGYDLVVQLAVELQRRDLPVTITIGGAGSEGQELRRLIAAAGVETVVTLAGVVERPYDFLRSGEVFLLMSRVEGMPNALLEAMCLGLPSISTKVGDVARFTRDGVDIRLVEIGDYMAVAAILEEWLGDWRRAVGIGAAGRRLCSQLFAPEVIGRNLTRTMRQLGAKNSSVVIV